MQLELHISRVVVSKNYSSTKWLTVTNSLIIYFISQNWFHYRTARRIKWDSVSDMPSKSSILQTLLLTPQIASRLLHRWRDSVWGLKCAEWQWAFNTLSQTSQKRSELCPQGREIMQLGCEPEGEDGGGGGKEGRFWWGKWNAKLGEWQQPSSAERTASWWADGTSAYILVPRTCHQGLSPRPNICLVVSWAEALSLHCDGPLMGWGSTW